MHDSIPRDPDAHDAEAILAKLGPDVFSVLEEQNLETAATLGDWVREACTPLGALSCSDRLVGAALELDSKGRSMEALAIRNAIELVKRIEIYADILAQFGKRASATEQTTRLAAKINDAWSRVLGFTDRDHHAAMNLIYCFKEGAVDRWKAVGLPPFPLKTHKWANRSVRGLEYFRLYFPEFARHLTADDLEMGMRAFQEPSRRRKGYEVAEKWSVASALLKKARIRAASAASVKTEWNRFQRRIS